MERSRFQLVMTGMGVSYHQKKKKKVRTCRRWGNIFWGVIENGGVNEPKMCLKYIEFDIKKIKF